MKKAFLFFVTLLVFSALPAQDIFELNQRLGKGINMGNMFEAPTETAWGNPFQDDYFGRIADLGFDHVRIPIRWDTPERTQQAAPYIINATFLNRIKSVVDMALAEDLYVIINMHHHEAIFANPDAVKPRFIAQWQQIANLFKDYDDRLLFEVLNEPNTNLTPAKWNVFFADALAEIRKTNPNRAVLMGVANWGGLGSVSDLDIPDDDRLILTVHYYEPFQFTHQGAEWVGNGSQAWLGTTWDDTNLEREEIELQFQFLETFSEANNIPIHIGEFGAYSRADLSSRIKWTNFLARWFEEQGYSWAYWEFSAGFGIYNPATGQYLQPLADALLTMPMSPPIMVNTQVVFESDFSSADNEWEFYTQPGAAGTFTTADGTAQVVVTQSSNTGWHIQLVKNNLLLKQGSQYLVTFEAAADQNMGFTNYLGKASGDYASYSGYKSYTATTDWTEFAYTFTMNSPDDPAARVAFDLANTATTFYLRNFVVEEVFDEMSTSTEEVIDPDLQLYPNPVRDVLQLEGIDEYKRFYLIDSQGKRLLSGPLNRESQRTIVLPKSSGDGVLYLLLEEDRKVVMRKVVRVR